MISVLFSTSQKNNYITAFHLEEHTTTHTLLCHNLLISKKAFFLLEFNFDDLALCFVTSSFSLNFMSIILVNFQMSIVNFSAA